MWRKDLFPTFIGLDRFSNKKKKSANKRKFSIFILKEKLFQQLTIHMKMFISFFQIYDNKKNFIVYYFAFILFSNFTSSKNK